MRKKMKPAPAGAVGIFSVLKGALIGTALCILLVLLYALALKQGWLKTTSMPVVTPALKVLGAGAAGLVAAWKADKRRWLLGGCAGLAFAMLSFMIFSILSSTFALSVAVLTDLGIGVLAGALAAILKSAMHR